MIKDIGKAIEALLAAPLVEEDDAETAALLAQLGLKPNRQNAILLQLIRQAGRGDIRSIQLVRELTGQIREDGTGLSAHLRELPVAVLEQMLEESEDCKT